MRKITILVASLTLFLSVCSVPTEKNKGPKTLSNESHSTSDGGHNEKYDHEAFLGKEEAAEFDTLPLEESKRRLRIICGKIDTNGDGYLSHDELKKWVQHVSHRYISDNVKEQFPQNDKNGDGKLSFEEYKESAFGVIDDPNDEYDPDRGLSFKAAIERDERRFKVADVNKDNFLDEEEYMAFLHPEEFQHTKEIHIDEVFQDMDKNKDGVITLEEYIEDLWPSRDRAEGEVEPEWVMDERDHFNKHRDKDGDNKLNKRELREWISPEEYDAAEAEASHLIHHADSDKDKKLSIEEVMENHELFVGSHATDFGNYLNRHDEF